jgi:O-antigen/teichoic acid export membrane protein
MPKKDKLKINIILNLLYEILVIAAPMITAPYVSRVLQADGIGKYSYTSSLLAYFTMFASLGTASYGQREIARLRGDKKRYSKIFWEIELCSVFTTCICLILWLLFAIMYDEYRTYMLAITYSLVAVLFDISWLYRGLEKFKYTVGINAFFKILSIILIFTLVKTENDLVRYMVIMSLGTLFGNVSMWLFLKREVVITRIELKALKSHLKTALVYFGPTIATSIYTVLDKTLIGVITQSNVENGYYEQATKIMNIVKSVSYSAINGVMASRACFLYSKKERLTIKSQV